MVKQNPWINFIFLLTFLILLTGCSEKSDGTQAFNETTSQEAVSDLLFGNLELEVLYEYEHNGDKDFGIENLRVSQYGNSIIFNVEQMNNSEEPRFKYILVNDQILDLRELSPYEDKENECCTEEHLSPNGRYALFTCLKMPLQFMIYDLETNQLIHEEPEWENGEDLELIGISNELDVFLRKSFEDLFIVYHVESKTKKEYHISDYTTAWEGHFEEAYFTNDGKKVLFSFFGRLHLFDLETEEITEVLNTMEYKEIFNTEDIFISNVRWSPDGENLYARIREHTQDPIYEGHYFINIHSGESNCYTDVEYSEFYQIDENGNMLLSQSDEFYLYSIPDDTVYQLPLPIVSGADNFVLTPDGTQIILTSYSNENGTRTEYINKIELGDITDFDQMEFLGIKEEQNSFLTENNHEVEEVSDRIDTEEREEEQTES